MDFASIYSYKRVGSDKTASGARSGFQRDYDRLIFSSAFRRLQNKTQVFPLPDLAFVHNRLTHSLEVASVGRSLGKMTGEKIASWFKNNNEDTYEFYKYELANVIAAACLAHDIGNPAFGHSGEKAISAYFQDNANQKIDNSELQSFFSDREWKQFEQVMQSAIDNLNHHRMDEGKSLITDLKLRIKNILTQQEEIIKLEPLRQQKIREGITRLLEENVGKENYDKNRLEQELIYYIEKIDITEEQVRLKNHCDYFVTVLNENEESKGKKLSFILQEIGREINTTGAKAYDAIIQKSVVLMKDELEKAKEQVLNVL